MTEDAPYARTLDILERLIGFPTVSATSNLALIDYVEALLVDAGFQTQRIPDPDRPKSGLVARIGGDGPGGVLLSAHSDVVPVDGQDWSRPPFELTREGDKLFGRGTTDMKGYLASMVSLAIRAGQGPLTHPLMLVISYDEEVGCQGIRKMLPAFERLNWSPDLCIVGEPTSMQPAIGHKGKAAFRAVFHGTAGHSALAPTFVNALHLAGDFLTTLRRLQDQYAAADPQDAAYSIPFSTVHAGRMQGGTALNIVPDRAEIEFEFRHLATDSVEDFQDALNHEVDVLAKPWRAIDPAAGAEVELTNSYPGFDVNGGDAAVQKLAALTGANQTVKVAFGTEAGFFAQIGIPTVVCGPGDMEGQGHKADEFLEVGQLAACDRMMDRILAELQWRPTPIALP